MNRLLVAVLTVVLAACGRDATTAPSFVRVAMPLTDRRSAAEGLFVPGWNQVRCFEARAPGKWDPDGDTMDNRCEDALAAAFAPGLEVARDCNYDPGVGRPSLRVRPGSRCGSADPPLRPRAVARRPRASG